MFDTYNHLPQVQPSIVLADLYQGPEVPEIIKMKNNIKKILKMSPYIIFKDEYVIILINIS